MSNRVSQNNNIVTVNLPTSQYGKQGPIGPPGPSGSQGISGLTGSIGPTGPSGSQGGQGGQGPLGPVGPSGSQGLPHNLQENTETGAFTTIPITGSIISASSFTGSLYGTASYTPTSFFVTSVSYAPVTSQSLEGEQAIEILNGAPKQLDFRVVSFNKGNIARNEWVASSNLKWDFIAPVSGKVILTIGYLSWKNNSTSPFGGPTYNGGPAVAISQVSPISSSIVIDNNDIDNYGPFSNNKWLWDVAGSAEDQVAFSPINLIQSGLTPGVSYTYYLYIQAKDTNVLSYYVSDIKVENYLQATSIVTTT